MFDVFGFYKFITISSLEKKKIILQKFLIQKKIRGTIILSPEGPQHLPFFYPAAWLDFGAQ